MFPHARAAGKCQGFLYPPLNRERTRDTTLATCLHHFLHLALAPPHFRFYIYPLTDDKKVAAALYCLIWAGLILLLLFMLECAPGSERPTNHQLHDFTISAGLHEAFCPNPKG